MVGSFLNLEMLYLKNYSTNQGKGLYKLKRMFTEKNELQKEFSQVFLVWVKPIIIPTSCLYIKAPITKKIFDKLLSSLLGPWIQLLWRLGLKMQTLKTYCVLKSILICNLTQKNKKSGFSISTWEKKKWKFYQGFSLKNWCG